MADPADTPSTAVGFLIWQLSARWQLEVDRALAPLGLTAAQYAVLASLHALSRSGHAPRQRELADFSGLDRIHVSKLVRALEGAGMLTRAPHPADSRAVAVSITRAGREAVTAARREVSALEEQRLLALGGRDDRRTEELVESLRALLRHTTR
ncbi:MarR family winged helix-turn-helix transcriptional regulator [Actinomadura monticuli]|uniref:MarR family transcriptional regulator n=1 Tax=Actinomadura monticuli TaxID=3097367 RepID=A0ABV4Q6E9_9ACTN